MKETRKETRTMAQAVKRAWKLQEFPAHAANVNSVSLGHKSGRVLVTGGSDKKVNLWAVGKPNCIMSLSGHSTPVDCVRFSITEEHVCAGSAVGTIKIWDLESTKILRTLTGHRASIRCVDFHPYGDFLASGSADSGIKMWDVRRRGYIFGYKGHNSTVNSLKFSPDGQWIASGGDDNLVKIWDIRVGRVLSEFSEHNAPVTDVEFHPHEFLLASGSNDKTVKFWDLETFSMVSSSLPDVPFVRSIAFHPNGSCLFAASQSGMSVHGWEPPETYDSVPISWSKVQDMAISQDQLIGVSTQMTNVSIFVVDLRRVLPIAKSIRAPLSAGHSLRKNFNKERSLDFAESLNAMKANEESDSLPTDPEDEMSSSQSEVKIPTDFHQVFQPHRDLTRTPPPEEIPVIEDEPSSHSTDPESPRPDPPKRQPRFNYVTSRSQSRQRSSPDTSPRRSSVPVLTNRLNAYPSSGARSQSPEYSSSRQSSLSDDSSGPHSSRSVDSYRVAPPEPSPRSEQLRTEVSNIRSPRRDGNQLTAFINHVPPSFQNRSPERPLAQCQVKPMPKISTPPSPLRDDHDPFIKTEYSKTQKDDYVPITLDKPSGVSIDDFLPKKSTVAFQGGVHVVDINESDVFTSLLREHQPLLTVLLSRQRNLRIIYNIWQTKDVKTAVETAVNLHDVTVLVDLLGVLVVRPSIWNLDLCMVLLPSILHLLQSRYEAHMQAGCSSLRLILKNFASVIKSNIESPLQTVGVDISREERYNKSMECYRHLVAIRAFTLKRQTLQGKIGHAFRELHILLSNLD